jgi:hypothetical protein
VPELPEEAVRQLHLPAHCGGTGTVPGGEKEMSKKYALLSPEPLTDFEESVLKLLDGVAETEYAPRAMVAAVLTDSGEVVTYYHNATMQDMMIAKGFIDLDIQNDNILGNLPFYLEQAEKDGLIGFEDAEYEEEEDEE